MLKKISLEDIESIFDEYVDMQLGQVDRLIGKDTIDPAVLVEKVSTRRHLNIVLNKIKEKIDKDIHKTVY